MPDYLALRDRVADQELPGGGKTFAGQADDPFFLDLRVFDLLYGGDLSEVGQDTLAGYNVNTIVLQVPKSELALNGDADAQPGDRRVEHHRSGAALEVLGRPTDRPAAVVRHLVTGVPARHRRWSTRWSSRSARRTRSTHSTPSDDAQFLDFVTDPEVPKLIEAIYKIPAPPTPRNDLVEVFLTGVCKDSLGRST